MKQINKLPTSGDILIEISEYQVELLVNNILPNITTIAYIPLGNDSKAKVDIELEKAELVKNIYMGTVIQSKKQIEQDNTVEVSSKMFTEFNYFVLGKSWVLSGKITGRISVKFLIIFSPQHKYMKYTLLQTNPILN